VLGPPHQHLQVISDIMANIRHYHVRQERTGHVAVLAIDDLEKMPLDQLAYNGKKVQATENPTLAPTSNYTNGRKLIFTSILVLTLDTIANALREQGKRPKLKRYTNDASSLPVAAAENYMRAENGGKKTVEITSTDRTGIPVSIIKAWVKDSKGHEQWSQPASGVQLDDDLLLLLRWLIEQDRNKITKLHQLLLSALDRTKPVPWIIVTSDGASDQSVQNLMTIIPLVELFQILDLDGLEKWNYCPNHSKFNPAEMLNRTVKGRFRGGVIESHDGSKETMEKVKEVAAAHLKGTTHGGERIRAIPQPSTTKELDRTRERWEIKIDYSQLKAFSEARTKIGPWKTTLVPIEVRQRWANSDDAEIESFIELEDKLQWAIKHARHHSLYGVVLAKCAPAALDKCTWCKDHPWRGDDWYQKRVTANNAVCPAAGDGCAERFCDHRLNKTYMGLLGKMNAITPEDGRTPRLCSICRQEGHNKKTCQRREQEA
jgi:hypothetical protein